MGVVIYGVVFGGLFLLVFVYVYGCGSCLLVWLLVVWFVLVVFVVFVIVLNFKYLVNLLLVGDFDMIGYCMGLFFLMIVILVVMMVFLVSVCCYLVVKFGQWNVLIVVGFVFVVIIVVVQIGLLLVSELLVDFLVVLLWKFCVVVIGMQVIMWMMIGLLFGVWVECGECIGIGVCVV